MQLTYLCFTWQRRNGGYIISKYFCIPSGNTLTIPIPSPASSMLLQHLHQRLPCMASGRTLSLNSYRILMDIPV